VVYSGRAEGVNDHFANLGYPCPKKENPADHLMDALSQAFVTDDPQGYEKLASQMNVTESDLLLGQEQPVIPPREMVPWHHQFLILCQRTFQDHKRRWRAVIVQLIETVLMAILVGTVFLQIGTNQVSISKRQSVLFFCAVNQGVFGALTLLNSLPRERRLVLRERAAGTYYVSAYFCAKLFVESLLQIPFPVIFSLIVYWLVGFQNEAGKFFIFMSFMLLCHFSALSLSNVVAAIGRTTEAAVTVLPMALEITRLFGGFYLSPAELPGYFVWLDAVSYLKYTYVAISLNELTGLEYNCTASEYKNITSFDNTTNTTSVTPTCPVTSGNQVITTWGFGYISIGGCAGVLIGYILGLYLISYIAVRFLKW